MVGLPAGGAVMNEDNRPHEIIIIKRGGEEEEGHHGGAWKIAFADFMTAMMALFLVLWLVNAANEETKKAVASYFNPVKLVERNQSKKGLEDQVEKPGGVAKSETEHNPSTPEKPETPAPGAAGEAFFRDPFTALTDIAAKEARVIEVKKLDTGNGALPLDGASEPFPNPFTPQTEEPPALPKAALALKEPLKPASKAGAEAEPIKPIPVNAEQPVPPTASAEAKDPVEAERETGDKTRKDRIDNLSKTILSEIKSELADAFGGADKMDAAITVVPVEQGVLISITDQLNYPMFDIGSPLPRGPIVLAMEKIALVVSKQTGPVRIYGHTDARAYRSAAQNNWNLSSERALSAYYMLIRAGLDEKRVAQITGFADRKLKSLSDPNADVNRRIELLLEVM
jgi:chemotaxis protein MotB